MALILVGVNHRTAPVQVRERLSISDNRLAEAVGELRTHGGVAGAALLSTCNRVEVVVSASSEDVTSSIVEWLAERAGAERTELENHLYVLRHGDVVKHLFRVAAGLDSMILGEPQIGGQVRGAFGISRDAGALDPVLQQLFDHTMRVAKRVRGETGIGEHAVSVPYAAVELAKKIFGDLRGLEVLLLGAGEMAELTAEHLAAHEVQQVFVANRAFERAAELARRFHGAAVEFDAVPRRLETSDIVIASTAAPHFVVTSEQVAQAFDARKRRNLFLIDLSVPRNLDPDIARLAGVYLYNIDDLQLVVDGNRDLRVQKADEAEAIVAQEVEAFRRRLASQDAVPTIVELQARLEEIRAAELEKCLRRLGPLSTEQRETVEMLTTQIVNKILHYPILQLKESAHEPQERESLRKTIRKIFGLR
jgi:glutamyl-tRNA reductase